MLIPQFTIVKDFEMLNFFVLSDWQLKRKKDKLNINERVVTKTYISIIYVAIIVFIFLQKPTCSTNGLCLLPQMYRRKMLDKE